MILKLKKELNNIKKQIKDNEIKFKEIHKNVESLFTLLDMTPNVGIYQYKDSFYGSFFNISNKVDSKKVSSFHLNLF